MANQLAALRAAGGQPHAVGNVVEALFERSQHQFASDTFLLNGFFIEIAELALQNLIVTAGLLFFAKLQTIADYFGFLVFAVLTRSEVALFNGTLFSVAALALQK